MARMPASAGIGGVGKSGSPAPRSMTSSPAARRRLASCEIAIVADVSRCWRLGESPWVMRHDTHARSPCATVCGLKSWDAAPALQRIHVRAQLPFVGQLDHPSRSEEHTSELQSRLHLVCRLLLEKKK